MLLVNTCYFPFYCVLHAYGPGNDEIKIHAHVALTYDNTICLNDVIIEDAWQFCFHLARVLVETFQSVN